MPNKSPIQSRTIERANKGDVNRRSSFGTQELFFTKVRLHSTKLHIAYYLMTQCSVRWPVMAPPSIGPGLLGLVTELTAQASRNKGNHFKQNTDTWPATIRKNRLQHYADEKTLNVSLILLPFCPIY